jgi:ribonuclease HI
MNETEFSTDFPVTIHLAASCKGNPGPGGWGCMMRKGSRWQTLNGNMKYTTNKHMELVAAIGALEHLTSPSTVTVITCSDYVVKGISKWIAGWRARGWTKSDGKPVDNLDLWQRLEALSLGHSIGWEWASAKSPSADGMKARTIAHRAAERARNGY